MQKRQCRFYETSRPSFNKQLGAFVGVCLLAVMLRISPLSSTPWSASQMYCSERPERWRSNLVNAVTRQILTEQLKRHEGLRLFPYHDSTGRLTIGYGRNIHDRGISREEAELLLAGDVVAAERHAENILGPVFQELPEEVQAVLVNMAFNLGPLGLRQFRRMLAAVEAGDFGTAAHEMLDSRWALQVGPRAVELAEVMREAAERG
jgi:lysozyme